MDLITTAFFAILVFFVWIIYCKDCRSNELSAELDRWHAYWGDTRKWLAEFPDAADALDCLKAEVDGTANTHASKFISETREAMRARRDGKSWHDDQAVIERNREIHRQIHGPGGLTAKAAAEAEAAFRVRYQHLGAEVADEEAPQHPIIPASRRGGFVDHG